MWPFQITDWVTRLEHRQYQFQQSRESKGLVCNTSLSDTHLLIDWVCNCSCVTRRIISSVACPTALIRQRCMNINNPQHIHAWDVTVQIILFQLQEESDAIEGLEMWIFKHQLHQLLVTRGMFLRSVFEGSVLAEFLCLMKASSSLLSFRLQPCCYGISMAILWSCHVAVHGCSIFFCIKRHANVEHPPTPVCMVTLFLILEFALLQLNDVDREVKCNYLYDRLKTNLWK